MSWRCCGSSGTHEGEGRFSNGAFDEHEWYDGNGYPTGLKGDDIPLAARIVGAVDAYCAMITARSYKEAYSEE